MPDFLRTYVSIARQIGVSKSLALDLASFLYTVLDIFGRFSKPDVAELLIIYTRHFYLDIDPIHQGAGDAFLIPSYYA